MKFARALHQALTQVGESGWSGPDAKLDAMHEELGSWKKVAGELGIDKRTLERWRLGYVPRGGGPRRHVARKHVADVIRPALGRNRAMQVAAVDWKQLSITGTITIGGGQYTRHENMSVGRYLTGDAIAGLAAAYVSGDDGRLQRAMDHAMSEEYIGDGATTLDDVDSLDFGA